MPRAKGKRKQRGAASHPDRKGHYPYPNKYTSKTTTHTLTYTERKRKCLPYRVTSVGSCIKENSKQTPPFFPAEENVFARCHTTTIHYYCCYTKQANRSKHYALVFRQSRPHFVLLYSWNNKIHCKNQNQLMDAKLSRMCVRCSRVFMSDIRRRSMRLWNTFTPYAKVSIASGTEDVALCVAINYEI